jgi:hypothetical protein
VVLRDARAKQPLSACARRPGWEKSFDAELASIVDVSFVDRSVCATKPAAIGGAEEQLVEMVLR